MKLIINEERFLAAIDHAGDHEVGAGLLAADPVMEPMEERVMVEEVRFEPTHLAFGSKTRQPTSSPNRRSEHDEVF